MLSAGERRYEDHTCPQAVRSVNDGSVRGSDVGSRLRVGGPVRLGGRFRAVGAGRIRELLAGAGETVNEGDLLSISERITQHPRGLADDLTLKPAPQRAAPMPGVILELFVQDRKSTRLNSSH